MILIQAIIGSILFFVVYKNYDQITKSESIEENYAQTFNLNAHNSAPQEKTPNTGEENMTYTGILGTIFIGHKDIGGSDYQKKTMSYREVKINPIVHDAVEIMMRQSPTLSRDKKTATYTIKQAQYNNFMQVINDLNFLTKYTNNSTLNNPTYNPREQLDTTLHHADDKTLIEYMQNKETQFNSIYLTREEKKGRNNNLISSEKFAYVYNQLHVDTEKKYKDHIILASQIFNLNPNIIKSCIFVEQLRAFYTFKWLFKSVAQTNTYLTVMSKQSFWVGGMKLETAAQFEDRLQTNNNELYQKYFAYPNQTNIWQQRLARLIDTKNYYYQVMYSAGILYQYSTERKNAGYNINNKPGLLATMYNIGYSTPHDNADIWWSFMNIEGDKYSFGGLAMLVYYYLEIYG